MSHCILYKPHMEVIIPYCSKVETPLSILCVTCLFTEKKVLFPSTLPCHILCGHFYTARALPIWFYHFSPYILQVYYDNMPLL
ncbi:hypothetical protein XENTR_v10005996 [Xenopus tropicalis]|nr:hypothetical protein XENTR_v10005996 [Xenopus tropicalis]